MKISTRRGAILLCTLALNVFFMLSPIGSVTLGARRCQQECDGEYGACQGNCADVYGTGTANWQGCVQQCQYDYYHVCSPSAITCGANNPAEQHCYECTDTCVWTDENTGNCVVYDESCGETDISDWCISW